MSIKELWDEYRICKQFEGVMGALQDSARDRSEGSCLRPEIKDINSVKNPHKKGKSIWIERMEIPEWFYQEVGYPRHGR
jgi:hypothetical protein